MDVVVTVRGRLSNFCDDVDLDGETLDVFVRPFLSDEASGGTLLGALLGVLDDEAVEIVAVERAPDPSAPELSMLPAPRVGDYQELIGRLVTAVEYLMPPGPHDGGVRYGHACDAECEQAYHLTSLLADARKATQ